MDYDYFGKLSPDEKRWLNDFNRVYYLEMRTAGVVKFKKRERAAVARKNDAAQKCINLTHAAPLGRTFATPSPEDAYIEAMDLQKIKKE